MSGPLRALLLAAGAGQRYGRLKQLEQLAGESLVRRTARTVLAAGLPLDVVIGAEAPRLRAELQDLPLTLIENPDWSQGMGGSIACAVRRMPADDPSALLLLLADQALLRSDDLRALIQAHRKFPDAILAADYGGRTLGPPCLFPRALRDELQALSGERGARGLLRLHAQQVQSLPMPHAGFDIDVPEDLARAATILADTVADTATTPFSSGASSPAGRAGHGRGRS